MAWQTAFIDRRSLISFAHQCLLEGFDVDAHAPTTWHRRSQGKVYRLLHLVLHRSRNPRPMMSGCGISSRRRRSNSRQAPSPRRIAWSNSREPPVWPSVSLHNRRPHFQHVHWPCCARTDTAARCTDTTPRIAVALTCTPVPGPRAPWSAT